MWVKLKIDGWLKSEHLFCPSLPGHYCLWVFFRSSSSSLLFKRLPPLCFLRMEERNLTSFARRWLLKERWYLPDKQLGGFRGSEGSMDADWQNGVTEDGLSGRANLKKDLLIYFHTAMCDDHKRTKYVCHSASHRNLHNVFVFFCPLQMDWLWLVCTQLNSPMRRWGTFSLFVRSSFLFFLLLDSVNTFLTFFIFENAPKFETIFWQQDLFPELINTVAVRITSTKSTKNF